MSGTLTYPVLEGRKRVLSVRLTVCSDSDKSCCGLAVLRRERLRRMMAEAENQGARLRYRDLSVIMLTSEATIKRDIRIIRRQGTGLPGNDLFGE